MELRYVRNTIGILLQQGKTKREREEGEEERLRSKRSELNESHTQVVVKRKSKFDELAMKQSSEVRSAMPGFNGDYVRIWFL